MWKVARWWGCSQTEHSEISHPIDISRVIRRLVFCFLLRRSEGLVGWLVFLAKPSRDPCESRGQSTLHEWVSRPKTVGSILGVLHRNVRVPGCCLGLIWYWCDALSPDQALQRLSARKNRHDRCQTVRSLPLMKLCATATALGSWPLVYPCLCGGQKVGR